MDDSSLIIKHIKLLQICAKTYMNGLNKPKVKKWVIHIKDLLLEIADQATNLNISMIKQILSFCEDLVNQKYFNFNESLIDIIIYLTTKLLWHDMKRNVEDFLIVFDSSLGVIRALMKCSWSTEIKPRLAAILGLYRVLGRNLCLAADTKAADGVVYVTGHAENKTKLHTLQVCAYKYYKLTTILLGHKQDIQIHCILLVADIIQNYVDIAVCEEVKIPMDNCLFEFLRISNDKINYLRSTLNKECLKILNIIEMEFEERNKLTN